ncbi:hypothetical protein EP7_001930 [Isosphaeraceae bacterium EP7]
MAQVVNRSSHVIEVYGTETASGTARRWILAPGKQTQATFNCSELRAGDEFGLEVFGSKDWWKVLTDYVFIYPPHGGDGFFTQDMTLHCVPFLPRSESAPPWRRGYEVSPADATRDGTPVTDPLDRVSEFPITEDELGVKEGELDSVLSGAAGFYAFGLQTRTWKRDDLYITVRLTADPSSSLSDDERKRLEGPVGGPTQLDVWKEKIETVWATAVGGSNGKTLHVECDWVESGGHYNIDIVTAGGSLFRRIVAKSTMEWWAIDIDDSTTTRDRVHVTAHEFGHHLGLDDGYYLQYEIPHLESDPVVQKFLADDANVKSLSNDPTRERKTEGFWGGFLSLPGFYQLFGRPERVDQRVDRGVRTTALSLMERPSDLNPAVIDRELVDAIVGRHLQPLYLAAELFFVRKPNSTT